MNRLNPFRGILCKSVSLFTHYLNGTSLCSNNGRKTLVRLSLGRIFCFKRKGGNYEKIFIHNTYAYMYDCYVFFLCGSKRRENAVKRRTPRRVYHSSRRVPLPRRKKGRYTKENRIQNQKGKKDVGYVR